MASKLVLIIVFIFDLIAFGLAVGAEQRRTTATIQADTEKDYNYCVYDSDIATGYGVGAFLFLLASQVIIMAASRCFCCGKAMSPTGSRACAVMLFLICWVSFLGAEACLVAGTVKNAHRNKYRGLYGFGDLDCETLGAGVFEAGAVLIMICSFASKMNHCWSDTDEELQTCDGRCSELGAYSPL
ncbi:hypothetical protein LINPERHAP1_LOCUS18518 [Linum perenne]